MCALKPSPDQQKELRRDAATQIFLMQIATVLIWLAVLTVDLYSPMQPPNEPPQQNKELWEL